MTYRIAVICAALCAFAILAGSPTRSDAAGTPLNVCNQTSTLINVAVSYKSSGPNDTATMLTGPTVSTGWWTVAAGACRNIANPFSARYVYWSGYVSGGDWFWTTSDYHFCVPNASEPPPGFTMEDENASEEACVNAAPFDRFGPNLWIASHEVDIDVMSTVYYNGS